MCSVLVQDEQNPLAGILLAYLFWTPQIRSFSRLR